MTPAPAESTLAHSAELRRELGVRDLVFAQVLMVVGGTWVGTAGKLGAAAFGVKMVGVVVAANAVGVGPYLAGKRRGARAIGESRADR